MNEKDPDELVIRDKNELHKYLIGCVERYAGVSVDIEEVTKIKKMLVCREIPHYHKIPPISSTDKRTPETASLLYMLCLSRGAIYGEEFGVYIDENGEFYAWLIPTPAVTAACETFNRIGVGMAAHDRCMTHYKDRIWYIPVSRLFVKKNPVYAKEVDKLWHREISTEARRMTMRGLITWKELKEEYEYIPDLQGKLKMIDVPGVTYLGNPTEQESLFDGKLATPNADELEIPDEEDYWKS
jgi:hypothetical protein